MTDPSSSLFASLHAALAVVDHAAASIYHSVAAAESDVTKWTVDNPNPVVASLFQQGIAYATTWLESYGVPVPALITAGGGISAALKAMAAADTSMPTASSAAAVVVAAPIASVGIGQAGTAFTSTMVGATP